MKLVMIYDVGDNCTWSSQITKPIEYESVERAEYDFLNLCEKTFAAYQNKEFVTGSGWTCNGYFYFCGEEYNLFDFYIREEILTARGKIKEMKSTYHGPEFYTLEDWFEKFKH